MKPGKYKARIVKYGVGEPKSGQRPSIFVVFQLSEGGEEIYWWGNMSDGKADAKKKPYEITIDSLITMGLRGNDPYVVADGVDSDALDSTIEYQLVIEDHEYNGKKTSRIRFINKPGQGVASISAQEATKLAGFSFAGEVMARRQELNAPDKPRASATTAPEETEDIPF